MKIKQYNYFMITTIILLSIFSMGAKAVFPEKPIKIIVPFGPGGGSDRIARTLDEFTKEEFGHSLIFDYKPGAGGSIGMNLLAKSKADGYTIGTYNIPDIVIGPLVGTAQYSLEDVDFLAQVSFEPVVFTTKVSNEFADINDFIAKAKQAHGKLSIGIAGAKGGTHLATLKLLDSLDIDVAIVLFGGGSELATAVLGNQVNIGVSGLAPFLGSIELVKVLGVAGESRNNQVPDVLTLKEQGIEMIAGTGRIFVAPKGLDEQIRQRLQTGIQNIFDNEDYKKAMENIGQQLNWLSGDELSAQLDQLEESLGAVIEKHGL